MSSNQEEGLNAIEILGIVFASIVACIGGIIVVLSYLKAKEEGEIEDKTQLTKVHPQQQLINDMNFLSTASGASTRDLTNSGNLDYISENRRVSASIQMIEEAILHESDSIQTLQNKMLRGIGSTKNHENIDIPRNRREGGFVW